jgi:alanyl-tRNA synthetase
VLLTGVFSNLLDDQFQEFAGEKIADPNMVVLLANIDNEMARLVLARNEGMTEIDCNKLFKRFAGAEGRGGGKPHFVTGVVNKDAINVMIDRIAGEILKLTEQ